MPIKRRATKAKKFTISDEARKIWREGRGEKICIFSDKSGVICSEKLAAALGLNAFVAMPNLRELAEQLSENATLDGDKTCQTFKNSNTQL